jgi:hypothetical protein
MTWSASVAVTEGLDDRQIAELKSSNEKYLDDAAELIDLAVRIGLEKVNLSGYRTQVPRNGTMTDFVSMSLSGDLTADAQKDG